MAIPRILIVDDEAPARAVIAASLEQLGYELREASTTDEARRIAYQWLPDLILLDVMMPGGNGIDACRDLRANPVTRDVPIIIVTALADRETRLEAIAAGADDVLTKPVDRVELRLRAQTICRLNRYRLRHEERARIAGLLEAGATPVMVIDRQGECLFANVAAERAFGIAPRAAGQEPALPSRLGPEVHERLWTAGQVAFDRWQSAHLPWPGSHLGGVSQVVVDGVTWAGEPGLRVEAVIMEQVTAAEETMRHRERLVSLGEVAVSAAHELASVLSAVDVSVRGLPEGEDTDRIAAAVSRGSRLVRQLLAFSHPADDVSGETSGGVLRTEVIPALALLVPSALTLRGEVDDVATLPLTRVSLEHVLLNLLINAYEGEATSAVIRLSRGATGEVELAVEDDGKGIPSEILERIGEAFVTSRPGTGHGLGVWTARRIVAACRGTLRYEPREGGGTRAICRFIA
jgi:CheY-like chemotaxis protein